MFKCREVEDSDWPVIDRLASDAVQQADHSLIDAQWTLNRREFNGLRYHSVLEDSGQVVGYCSLERQDEASPDRFRVFLVTTWNDDNRLIQEELLSQLERLISAARAKSLWMRELVDDSLLIEFMLEKGFTASEPYWLDQLHLVNLDRSCVSSLE